MIRLPPSLLLQLSKAVLLLALLCCAGCAVHPDTPQEYLRIQHLAEPHGESLQVCTGFSCTTKASIQLENSFWDEVGSVLKNSRSAREERQALGRAVGLFERRAGELAGFSHDMAKNRRNKKSHQLDCVAETANTTVFLMTLEHRGLLTFHVVDRPAHRGTLIFYAHNTATIRETHSGLRFAVDSWFFENGRDAEIVPLDQWLNGWKPQDPAS